MRCLRCVLLAVVPTENESADVDSAAVERGDTGDSDAENALYRGVLELRHTEGHTLRQHPGQDEPHDGAGGGRPLLLRGDGRARLLLRHLRLAVQPAHEEAARRHPRLRREAALRAGSGLRLHGPGRVPLVVGVLQETLHRLLALRQQQQQQQRQGPVPPAAACQTGPATAADLT